MFPWRARSREVVAYLPHWDLLELDVPTVTLDLSHGRLRLRRGAGAGRAGDRLSHVHLADGSGSNKDEHLVPGRGNQPCAEVLERLARAGYDGSVVLEINTGARSTGTSGRPTSPRDWPSPASTWPPRAAP